MLQEKTFTPCPTGIAAGEYFDNGFHCAEAVARAVLDKLGMDGREAAAHATAFGGGVGRSFQEACGALTGGIIAIGHVHGRREPGGSWDLPAELGAELRSRFVKEFGCTTCSVLRERFGPEEMDEECYRVVQRTAGMVKGLLGEDRTGIQPLDCNRAACACGCGQ